MNERSSLWLFAAAVLLGIAVVGYHPPIIYNQASHFVHGLIAADYGHLRHDWLATTRSAFPAFDLIVGFAYRTDALWTFAVLHALLLGLFLYALVDLALWAAGTDARRRPWFAIFLLVLFVLLFRPFVGTYKPLISQATLWLINADIPEILFGTFGSFQLLDNYFQATDFGALLTLSLALYLRGRPVAAGVAIAIAGTFHLVYLLPGALLVLCYMWRLGPVLGRHGRALGVGVVALGLVLPAVLYLAKTFGGGSVSAMQEGYGVWAEGRAPHHVFAYRWLLENVAGKLLLMAGAAWLMRDTVVRPVMIAFIVLVLGSVGLFEVTRFYPLAALEPWRGMVCVAPAASAIVLGRGLAALDTRMAGRGPWRALAAAGLAGLLAWSAWLGVTGTLRAAETGPKATRHDAVADHVAATAQREHLYLYPAFWRWRMFHVETGVRAYADSKARPYGADEIIEWDRRVNRAKSVYQGDRIADCDSLTALVVEAGITHVVAASDSPPCRGFARAYDDGSHAVLVFEGGG